MQLRSEQCNMSCAAHQDAPPPHACRYDLDKLIANKDKAARKQAQQLQDVAMGALSDVSAPACTAPACAAGICVHSWLLTGILLGQLCLHIGAAAECPQCSISYTGSLPCTKDARPGAGWTPGCLTAMVKHLCLRCSWT